LFVKPVSRAAILHDLALTIWWALIIWLLITGFQRIETDGLKVVRYPPRGPDCPHARRWCTMAHRDWLIAPLTPRARKEVVIPNENGKSRLARSMFGCRVLQLDLSPDCHRPSQLQRR
jgi:hypothetical protein